MIDNADRVIIVAAGLATRMGSVVNGIPKVLVNIGSKTVLERIIDTYGVEKHYRIICHSSFIALIKAFLAEHLPLVNVSVEYVDEPFGTAYALMHGAADMMDGKPVLITWSDIYFSTRLTSKIQIGESNRPTVFTQHDASCRYRYRHNTGEVIKLDDNCGNVVGIYHVPEFKPFSYNNGDDFVDVITQLSHDARLDEFRIGQMGYELRDVGDIDKLESTAKLETDYVTRPFNAIGERKIMHKRPLNELGRVLSVREINWYKQIAQCEGSHPRVAEVWCKLNASDSDGFMMERIHGETVANAILNMADPSGRDRVSLVARHIKAVHSIHDLSTSARQSRLDSLKDIRQETTVKTSHRITKALSITDNIRSNVNEVNGVTLAAPIDELAEHLGESIFEYYRALSGPDFDRSIGPIHGDCNFSNALVTGQYSNGPITLIDPRGYFGNHQGILGLFDYDYAKILYSLSGYDLFNSAKLFKLDTLEGRSVSFKMPQYECFSDGQLAWINAVISSDIRQRWVALIWLNLAAYSSNNPIKAFAALHHGALLANKFYLADKGTK
jgi:hypothetical protein